MNSPHLGSSADSPRSPNIRDKDVSAILILVPRVVPLVVLTISTRRDPCMSLPAGYAMFFLRMMSTPSTIANKTPEITRMSVTLSIFVSSFVSRVCTLSRSSFDEPLLKTLHDRDCGRPQRSEERRVGKECRSRWSPDHSNKKAAAPAEASAGVGLPLVLCCGELGGEWR